MAAWIAKPPAVILAATALRATAAAIVIAREASRFVPIAIAAATLRATPS